MNPGGDMPNPATNEDHTDHSNNGSRAHDSGKPVPDEAAQRALDDGDNEKIDRALDELDVSTTRSGKDQSAKPDTEGSNSSSKNLDEQDD
jgi:hypothetical protein